MTFTDFLVLVIFIVLPVLLLLVFIARSFLPTRPRWSAKIGAAPAPIVRTLDSIASSVASMAEAAVDISSSVISQAVTVAQSTISVCAFVAANLHGLFGSVIQRLQSDTETIHALTVDGTYELVVRFQGQRPETYRGGSVRIVKPPTPVRVTVLVDGAYLDVAQGGHSEIEVQPAAVASTRFRIRPERLGRTTLHVEIFRGNIWMQRLSLSLHVCADAASEQVDSQLVDSVESSLTLPELLQVPEPRDLQVNIAFSPGQGRTFRARAKAAASMAAWRYLEVDCREADVSEINSGLRAALQDLRRVLGRRDALTNDDALEPEYRRSLEQLARRGNDALLRVLPKAEDQAYVRNALARPASSNIEISSDSFFVPWELFYDGHPSRDVDMARFWGFRYCLTRVLSAHAQTDSPVMPVENRPRLSVFAHIGLQSVADRELPFFRRLRDDGSIVLHDWVAEHNAAPVDLERQAFFEFLRNTADVCHFACHAVSETYSRASYLALSGDLRITLEDMNVEQCHLDGSPFVVLNACGTGIRDPSKTSDFVRTLMRCGARGVLATECDVPDSFASVFVQDLYARVLRGEAFASSLLDTRRLFLRDYNNPLGLLYSAYLPVEARLRVRAPAEKISGS